MHLHTTDTSKTNMTQAYAFTCYRYHQNRHDQSLCIYTLLIPSNIRPKHLPSHKGAGLTGLAADAGCWIGEQEQWVCLALTPHSFTLCLIFRLWAALWAETNCLHAPGLPFISLTHMCPNLDCTTIAQIAALTPMLRCALHLPPGTVA